MTKDKKIYFGLVVFSLSLAIFAALISNHVFFIGLQMANAYLSANTLLRFLKREGYILKD